MRFSKNLMEVRVLWVVFEKRNGRIVFEVIRSSERDERIFTRLFDRYGREIVKEVPVGVPLNIDVYRLKKILEGRRRRRKRWTSFSGR